MPNTQAPLAAEIIQQAAALHQKGDLANAARLYESVLELDPQHFDVRHLLAAVSAAQGKFEEAIAHYDKAVSLQPRNAVAVHNRGKVALALNRVDEAMADFERALVLKPDFAEALCSFGNALAFQKRYDEAVACYDGVLSTHSTHWEALNNRGNVLSALGRHPEAIKSYDQAIDARPGEPAPYFNRGLTRFALSQHVEAIADFDRTLALNPDHAEALHTRGNSLRILRRHEEAATSYAEAVARNPDLKYVRGDALHARMQLCDWAGYEQSVMRVLDGVYEGRPVIVPFALFSFSDDPSAHLACAKAYARSNHSVKQLPLRHPERRDHQRIRLAYLSANFHDHAVARHMVELFELHDRKRFETLGISFGPDSLGGTRARVRAGLDQFIDVRASNDADVAAMIRERKIDIAIDLMGFTEGARPGILALRPAPIQISYIGYPGTMGSDFIDYIIGDKFVTPIEDEKNYSECVVRLPDSYQVNDSKRRMGDHMPTRSDVGLPERDFVFCCFNNNSKILPAVFDVWMRLLQNVDRTVLWLLRGSASAERNLRREAESRGIDADRLVFAPYAPLDDHMSRHRLADLFLDTTPYNAHATASNALWAGLPVLTCTGRTFASRVGASLLNALNLSELVTTSLAEYEARALELATSPAELGSLREKLTRNRLTAPLFDTDRFRRHIEAAYVTMWEAWKRGEKPRSFEVPLIDR